MLAIYNNTDPKHYNKMCLPYVRERHNCFVFLVLLFVIFLTSVISIDILTEVVTFLLSNFERINSSLDIERKEDALKEKKVKVFKYVVLLKVLYGRFLGGMKAQTKNSINHLTAERKKKIQPAEITSSHLFPDHS